MTTETTDKPEQEDEFVERPTSEYLRDLSERLRHVPVMYGVDGYDIDRLPEIAKERDDLLSALKYAKRFIEGADMAYIEATISKAEEGQS